MEKSELLSGMHHGLIVSCQALPGEPLYRPQGGVMPLMAKAAWQAGAVGIRANGVQDILGIRREVALPVIGIVKRDYPNSNVYITPTMEEVDALAETGCEIIAMDFTREMRPDGECAADFLKQVRARYAEPLLMADCSSLEDAIAAQDAGADLVGTTLNGYLPGDLPVNGPSFELIRQITKHVRIPVIAEGRIQEPWQARRMLELGAWAVVVGAAITRPLLIAKNFVDEMKLFAEDRTIAALHVV